MRRNKPEISGNDVADEIADAHHHDGTIHHVRADHHERNE